MTKRAFDKISAGLAEAKAYLDGTADVSRYRVHVLETIDVKRIRARLGLSQEAFAATYGFAFPPCATGSKAAASPTAARACS